MYLHIRSESRAFGSEANTWRTIPRERFSAEDYVKQKVPVRRIARNILRGTETEKEGERKGEERNERVRASHLPLAALRGECRLIFACSVGNNHGEKVLTHGLAESRVFISEMELLLAAESAPALTSRAKFLICPLCPLLPLSDPFEIYVYLVYRENRTRSYSS